MPPAPELAERIADTGAANIMISDSDQVHRTWESAAGPALKAPGRRSAPEAARVARGEFNMESCAAGLIFGARSYILRPDHESSTFHSDCGGERMRGTGGVRDTRAAGC